MTLLSRTHRADRPGEAGVLKLPCHHAHRPSEMRTFFVKVWVLEDLKQTSGCAIVALATRTQC